MSFEIIAGFPGQGKGTHENWPDKRLETAVWSGNRIRKKRTDPNRVNGDRRLCALRAVRQSGAADGANRHRPGRWSSFVSRAHLWFSVDRTFGSVVR